MKHSGKRLIALILTIAVLVAMVPATAVTSYGFDASSDTEEKMTEALTNLALKVLGSETFDCLYDLASAVPTYSELAGDKTYSSYLNIGDSTTFGYGIGTMDYYAWDFLNSWGWGKCDPEAWPYKTAKALGIEFNEHDENEEVVLSILAGEAGVEGTEGDVTPYYLDLTEEGNHFASLGVGSIRTWEVLRYLGKSEATDVFTERYFDPEISAVSMSIPNGNGGVTYAWEITGGTESMPVETIGDVYRKNIQGADLISVSLGGNDTALVYGLASYAGYGPEDLNWDYLYENNPAIEKAANTCAPLIVELLREDNEGLPDSELMDNALLLLYGYLGILTNYAELIDTIHELNPDATVALMGEFNILDRLYIQSEDTNNEEIRIGKAVRVITSLTNRVARSYAMNHPDWCCYVDMSGVELLCEDESRNIVTDQNYNLAENPDAYDQMIDYWDLGVHESELGHTQISERLLEALYPDRSISFEEKMRTETEEKAASIRDAVLADFSEDLAEVLETHSEKTRALRNAMEYMDAMIAEQAESVHEIISENVEAFHENTKVVVEAALRAETPAEAVENILETGSGLFMAQLENTVTKVREESVKVISFWKGFGSGFFVDL